MSLVSHLFRFLMVLMVVASTMAQDRPVSLNADPISMGRIFVYSVFSVVFFIFAIISAICFYLRRGHRRLYAFLVPANILIFIELATHVVDLVLANLSNFDPPAEIINLMVSMNAFSGYWSWMAVFMAVVLVLHDRLTACDDLISSEKAYGTSTPTSFMSVTRRDFVRKKIFMYCHIALAVLVLALGTASAALVTSLNDDRIMRRITSGRVFKERVDIINRVFYAFNSFVIFTSVAVLAYALYVRRRWKSMGKADKILSMAIYVVLPSYMLLMANRLTFTILFSPSGFDTTTPGGQEALGRGTLANSIINQVFLFATIAPLVVLGLSKDKWDTQGYRNLSPRYYDF